MKTFIPVRYAILAMFADLLESEVFSSRLVHKYEIGLRMCKDTTAAIENMYT